MGVERVHLQLMDRNFHKTKKTASSETVKEIADRIFNDVEFRFYTHQEEGDVILFSPNGIDNYSQKYVGHAIEVLQRPGRFPVITFSTGNRGDAGLNSKQRKKYFQFAVCLNDTLLEIAKI